MSGVQCKKRLYLHKNHEKFGIKRDKLTAQQEAVFATGTAVGELAQQLFPGGVDCTPESYYDFGPSLELTKQSIADVKTVIYEAAFQYDQVLVALDILVKKDDGWHAYEVKSTNDTKPQHIHDATLQYWVMTNAGLNIQTINILHFNKEYVRRGELNIEELFTWDDVTEQVEEILPTIRPEVKACKAVLQEPEIPVQDIGPHCSKPYDCDFRGHCWKHVPEYSVLNLTNPRGKQWDLYLQGIMKTTDIPEGYPLSTAQQYQVQADKTGESFIDSDAIAAFTSQLTYPLYFMDFETIQSAIPIYDETRPYQMAVFQYSVHIQKEEGGTVEHKEYLADPKDPNLRKTVAQRLIDELGSTGSVIVYNNSFEGPRLNELARDYPELAAKLQAIADRIVDLAVPFRQRAYYTSEMRGRHSIKTVLPALVPELSYKDLVIQEGGTASLTFLQMVQRQFDGDEEKTREALIKYCELDTLAMVKILKELDNNIA
ncbi:MAG: DUF2779 domain-containing protein [Flavobacteriales bacterium]|nr:DUF2779 domain-containing protein [Flavobacteriales bacterium]